MVWLKNSDNRQGTQVSKTLEYSYDTDQLIQVLSPNNYVIKYIHSDDTVSYEKGVNLGIKRQRFIMGHLF
jgi:hypothetical protein